MEYLDYGVTELWSGEELTHWKRLMLEGIGGRRRRGRPRMRWLDGIMDLMVGDGQGGLACCDSWGHKESYTTERLNWTELIFNYEVITVTYTCHVKKFDIQTSFKVLKSCLAHWQQRASYSCTDFKTLLLLLTPVWPHDPVFYVKYYGPYV